MNTTTLLQHGMKVGKLLLRGGAIPLTVSWSPIDSTVCAVGGSPGAERRRRVQTIGLRLDGLLLLLERRPFMSDLVDFFVSCYRLLS